MIDSNTPFWPTTLPVPLITAQPEVNPKSIFTIMETGRARKRRVFDQQLEMVKVEWNFTEDQFDTFKTFYETQLENGSLTFVIDLFPDESAGHREVGFAEDQYSFARSDNLFSVQATLLLTKEDFPEWNFAACEVSTVASEGGDSFDCYPPGIYPDMLFQSGFRYLGGLSGGTRFTVSSVWLFEVGDFTPYGDDFDSYPIGLFTNLNGGDGFATGWIHDDGHI